MLIKTFLDIVYLNCIFCNYIIIASVVFKVYTRMIDPLKLISPIKLKLTN